MLGRLLRLAQVTEWTAAVAWQRAPARDDTVTFLLVIPLPLLYPRRAHARAILLLRTRTDCWRGKSIEVEFKQQMHKTIAHLHRTKAARPKRAAKARKDYARQHFFFFFACTRTHHHGLGLFQSTRTATSGLVSKRRQAGTTSGASSCEKRTLRNTVPACPPSEKSSPTDEVRACLAAAATKCV